MKIMNKKMGFTAVEIIVSIAAAGILASLAIPGYHAFKMDDDIAGSAEQLVDDINYARASAVKHQRNATICVSTSAATETPACTGGTDWSAGWIVWVDVNQNGVTDTSEVLKVAESLAEPVSFSSVSLSSFIYNSRGFILANDTLNVCDTRAGETGRQITITTSGRPEVQELVCS